MRRRAMLLTSTSLVDMASGVDLSVLLIGGGWSATSPIAALAVGPGVGALLILAAALGRLDPIARVEVSLDWYDRLFTLAMLVMAVWMIVGILTAGRGGETEPAVECYAYDTAFSWACD
jgi:hypothetical protein